MEGRGELAGGGRDGGGSLPAESSAAGGPPELTLQRADVSLTARITLVAVEDGVCQALQ